MIWPDSDKRTSRDFGLLREVMISSFPFAPKMLAVMNGGLERTNVVMA
jgi:hypothetical protein